MPGKDPERLAGLDWLTVEDPAQARLLTASGSARFFVPFVARERTVSEAARELGCRVDTMLYRVRQFLEAGLLVVSRIEPRAGRPIKHYRSVADAFFVPFSATPYADVEELILRQSRPFHERVARSSARLLHESGRDGRRIYREENGEVWNDSAAAADNPFRLDEEGVPTAYDFRVEVKLEPAEARRLQSELHDLLERYTRGNRKAGKAYLWEAVLIPALD